MDLGRFAFLFGLAFVLLAFCLKAGLFNGRLRQADKIGWLHHIAEFPIDATMAAVPVLVTAAATQFREDPAHLLWFPFALLIVVLQIFCFKDIRIRASAPGTQLDIVFIPLWLFLSYMGLLYIALRTLSMIEQVVA